MSSLNTSVNDDHFAGPSRNNGANVDEDDFMMDDTIDLTYSDDDDYVIETSSNEDSDVSFVAENAKDPLLVPETKNSCDNLNSPLSGSSSNRRFSLESLKELYERSTEEVIQTISDLLSWLSSNAITDIEDLCVNVFDPNDVYYVSCALWICQKLPCNSQVSALLTPDIFSLYLKWSSNMSVTSATKLAIDRVLCSMYVLRPEMYVTLLESMNIILPEEHTSDHQPYQFKHITMFDLQSPYHVNRLPLDLFQSMTNFKFTTLANISQSSISVHQLIQSGCLSLLVDNAIDICVSYKPVIAEYYQSTLFGNLTSILNFFTELCLDGEIRKWLASDGNVVFWERLFELLAETVKKDAAKTLSDLCDSTIRFFCKCCWGYPENLNKLANTLVTVYPRFMVQDSFGKSTSISQFARQIIIKLIMAIEKVYVCVETNLPYNFRSTWSFKNDMPPLPPPAYPSTSKQRLIYVDTNLNCVDIIAEVMGQYSDVTNRAKQLLESSNVSSPKKFKCEENPKLFLWVHSESRYVSINQTMNIAQMLSILHINGDELEMPIIKVLLTEQENTEAVYTAEWTTPISLLRSLVDINGFETMANHSPIIVASRKSSRSRIKAAVANTHSVAHPSNGFATVQSPERPRRFFKWSLTRLHSLMLFGQLMKLKDYREEVQRKHSLETLWGDACVEYFDIDKLKTYFAYDPVKLSNPIATLPLHLLYLCLKRLTLDVSNVRSDIITYGVVDMMLCCLTVFTHQSEKSKEDIAGNPHTPLLSAVKQATTPVRNKAATSSSKDKNYWPKGVGYGSDSYGGKDTHSEIRLATHRVQEEEEFVAVLFYVLAAYINPDFRLYELYPEYLDDICNADIEITTKLPRSFLDQVERSCLLPILADYLRNDSIMDICRHVSLYKALMQLLRCFASSEQMIKYLVSNDHSSADCSTSSDTCFVSLNGLLQKIKNLADTYSFSLVKTSVAGPSTSAAAAVADDSNDEDENLISDIKITAIIVNIISERYQQTKNTSAEVQQPAESETSTRKISPAAVPTPVVAAVESNEAMYLRVMKKFSFASYDIIPETGTSGVSYAYRGALHKEQVNHPSRMRRLALESSALATSLPLTYSSAVFVRCDTNRLDVMKVLITGPANTPYMNGCFEFDVNFPADYPARPMDIRLMTTGHHKIRFNPNLYENGKVCLSLLNTWSGSKEEMWNPQTSTLVQVLISIQALIFVPDPYFNEPGYQTVRGTANGTRSSNMYNARLLPSTVTWAMVEQMRKPSPCFEDVIKAHFWLKKNEILRQVADWMEEHKDSTALRNACQALTAELNKLKPPTEEI